MHKQHGTVAPAPGQHIHTFQLHVRCVCGALCPTELPCIQCCVYFVCKTNTKFLDDFFNFSTKLIPVNAKLVMKIPGNAKLVLKIPGNAKLVLKIPGNAKLVLDFQMGGKYKLVANTKLSK